MFDSTAIITKPDDKHQGFLQGLVSICYTTPVMGKLFKEGAKGKEKNFRRANIIY